jgi:hypothetical protein
MKKKPIWYESAKRHAYQAWVGNNCAVAILPEKYKWRWRVGTGDLTSTPEPFDPASSRIAKEGVVKTREAAKRAALKAAAKTCPIGPRRKRAR